MKINTQHLNVLLDAYLERILVWTRTNRLRVVLFVLIVSMLSTFSWLPYFNLIFIKETVIFLTLLSLYVIFRVDWKAIMYVCFGLFVISYFFDLFGMLPLSELIGSYIYGFMVLIVIKFTSSI
ncbi:MAG: hypothetical protein HYV90_02975 [Candidatus Woesebacteria bacterium]|nr:MAG: hypothetical protein HYV90_02975 [Candidatus Woesebacteria bacterium]